MFALGLSRVKVGLLVALARHHGQAPGRILAAELGIAPQLASNNLRQLEAAGLVTADRPAKGPGDRQGGRQVVWTVNYDVLRTQLDELTKAVLPDDD